MLTSCNCILWNLKSYNLRFNNENKEIVINPYSPECNIDSNFVSASTLEELEDLKDIDISEKIIILFGSLSKEILFPKSFPFYTDETHQKIYELLEKLNPLAVIFISHSHFHPVALSADDEFKIPSITVSADLGCEFLKNPTKKIELIISADFKDSIAHHIIGRLNPNYKEKIIINAHLDTTYFSLGAHDNCSGVLCIMELARVLKNLKLQKCIEFVAISSHEYSGKGELTYINSLKNKYSEIKLFINIDAVAHWIIPDKISYYNFNDKDLENFNQILSNYNGISNGEQWYASEHVFYAQQGCPCIALSTGKSSNTHHTPFDKFDHLNPEKIEYLSEVLEQLINSID